MKWTQSEQLDLFKKPQKSDLDMRDKSTKMLISIVKRMHHDPSSGMYQRALKELQKRGLPADPWKKPKAGWTATAIEQPDLPAMPTPGTDPCPLCGSIMDILDDDGRPTGNWEANLCHGCERWVCDDCIDWQACEDSLDEEDIKCVRCTGRAQ